jgi:hypothetical protein
MKLQELFVALIVVGAACLLLALLVPILGAW